MQKSFYFLYFTSDMFETEQHLRKLGEAACILSLSFPNNFLIAKSRLSLNNSKILRE